jgi:DNA-binding MarR family transcriptional regulator
MSELSDEDFSLLLRTRCELRRFTRYIEDAARNAGITPAQHQLLLAVRGTQDPDGPRIRDLADLLFIAHHSTVELIDRTAAAGLVERHTDKRDQRVVRVRLTPRGERILTELTPTHLHELQRLRSAFSQLAEALPGPDR